MRLSNRIVYTTKFLVVAIEGKKKKKKRIERLTARRASEMRCRVAKLRHGPKSNKRFEM